MEVKPRDDHVPNDAILVDEVRDACLRETK